MQMLKRIFLFGLINILIIATISVVMNIFGVQPYLEQNGINYSSLLIFCAIWGFGGAFISLALSRVMAKAMMGVKLIDANDPNVDHRMLVQRIYGFAKQAGLQTMPEVGIYESPEVNAFATGPTKNRSLVAVSRGLLNSMNQTETDGVLAHEVSHIANGDMVTMTLLQGLINVFVMFFARIIAFGVSQTVDENKRYMVNFGVILVCEILLGLLGLMVLAAFSRYREYRADAGSARLAGTHAMVSSLQALQRTMQRTLPQNQAEESPALASLKISGKAGGLLSLFATHPSLEKRIEALQKRQYV